MVCANKNGDFESEAAQFMKHKCVFAKVTYFWGKYLDRDFWDLRIYRMERKQASGHKVYNLPDVCMKGIG